MDETQSYSCADNPRPAALPTRAALTRLLLGVVAALTTLLAVAPAVAAHGWIREQQRVELHGATETWTLAWREKPKEGSCSPREVEIAISCPCSGFAYSEEGRLTLTRTRPGEAPDTLSLDSLFGPYDWLDNPVWEAAGRLSALNRWGAVRDGDFDREFKGDRAIAAEIRRRPAPKIMQMADYVGDGTKSSFLLQIGTRPCGKHQFVAIGTTKVNPRLHPLTSEERPLRPLVMPIQAWEALAQGPGPHTVLVWNCDDHSSEVQSEFVLAVRNGVISAIDRDYACPYDPEHPKLVSESPV